MLHSRVGYWAVSVALLVLTGVYAGCLNRPLAPVDPSTQSGVFVEISQTGTTKVDILFVIDNSNSMFQEQAILAREIDTMVRELITPTTAEGQPPPPSVEDMHIGIVTTDMGVGGFAVRTCEENQHVGDNGELQNVGNGDGCQPVYNAADCTQTTCPWLVHSTDFPDADPENAPIWEDFACLATLGTGGCGLEQQLESSLIALTTQAQAGGANEGFLRDDSLIAIIYVTDEDDCSAENTAIFDRTRSDLGDLNTRCALYRGQDPNINPLLYPLSRYHEGFLGLRPGNDNLVVVAAIVGIPTDPAVWAVGDSIDRLRELQREDLNDPGNLVPSCHTDNGYAFPPVRIAELIYMFGENGVLESICRASWIEALTAIKDKIQSKLQGACMDRELADTDPDVCRVIETLTTPGATCSNIANSNDANRVEGWKLPLDPDEEGRTQCEILPADYNGDGRPDGVSGGPECDAEPYANCLAGWFYDSASEECPSGQVRFTSTDVTADLADVRFECRTALCPQRRQCVSAAQTGAECTTDAECGGGQCIRHNSEEVCCGPTGPGCGTATCLRCTATVGERCSFIREHNPYWAEEPLVEAGGCCHEGFYCENGSCEPNRTTRCE